MARHITEHCATYEEAAARVAALRAFGIPAWLTSSTLRLFISEMGPYYTPADFATLTIVNWPERCISCSRETCRADCTLPARPLDTYQEFVCYVIRIPREET